MKDPSGTMTFSYDARGRLTGKNSDIYGHSYTIGTTFSPGSRVMNVTYPSGRSMDYIRDTMGRMKDLSTTYDGNTVTLISNMTYNPFGSPKGMGTGSGESVNNVSSECGCVTVANPGEQMERTFSYDGNSNLTSIQGTNTPWYNQTFTYDALNRLINAEGMYGTIGYTYDRVGNRMTRTVNVDTETYSYLPGTNKLDTIIGPGDPVTYSYDDNGNVTALGGKTLVYKQNNRLISVEKDSTVLGEYTYNGSGQRIIKAASGVTTIYHYDLNGKLIAESTSDADFVTEYLYMGKIRMAMVDVDNGAMYYYLNDRLGIPLLMTNDTGTVVWEAYYKPFGEATINPNSSVVNNIRLPGQYEDEETGLHYNYHRYYDPRTGRYVTPDPLSFSQVQIAGQFFINRILGHSLNINDESEIKQFYFRNILHYSNFSNIQISNLFAYVLNNPINYTDVMGLQGSQWDLISSYKALHGANPQQVRQLTDQEKQALRDLVVHFIENLSNLVPGPITGVLQTEEQIKKYIQELYGIFDPEGAGACENK